MSSKLKVLCIGHSYILAVNRSTARKLATMDDFEVTVIAPHFFHGDLRNLHLEPETKDSPLKVMGTATTGSRFIHGFYYDLKPVRELLLKERFDVIYIWEEPFIVSGWQLARLARKIKIPYCFHTFQNIAKSYPPPFSWFEKQVVCGMAGWTAGGQLVYDLLSMRGYNPATGVVMPMAVDTTLFQPRDSTREPNPVSHMIGFVGRLIPEKGVGILLKALELLPENLPWSVLFLGSGSEEKTILEWAQKRSWSNRVRVILAKHDEVPTYLQQMDVLVAPSQTTSQWKEQFGRMIIEAFACGVPVIGSDSGEIPFVIGNAGIIVPEGNANALATQIASLLQDVNRREELKSKGLIRVAEFSSESLAKRHSTFFRDVISRIAA